MINKASLLTDETEKILFGNADDRTVDDAFNMISRKLSLIMQNVAELTLTVQDSAGHGIPGVLITNLFDDAGNPVYTNSGGAASGYIPEGNTTISITGYADIENYSETIAVVKGEAYTKTWTVTTRDFLKITSTQNVKFSGNVTRVDATVVGGGGGGAGGSATQYANFAGAGGGGGYCVVQENVSFQPRTDYQAKVGAGGKGGNGAGNNASTATAGTKGGQSSFLGISAEGGGGGNIGEGGAQGGAGNGKGGNSPSTYNTNGLNGANGSVLGYSSFTETVRYGGGGASSAFGESREIYGGTGGEGYGGDGGRYSPGLPISSTAGVNGYGGGGAGGYAEKYESGSGIVESGRDGGSGCIAIRMHLASAA